MTHLLHEPLDSPHGGAARARARLEQDAAGRARGGLRDVEHGGRLEEGDDLVERGELGAVVAGGRAGGCEG